MFFLSLLLLFIRWLAETNILLFFFVLFLFILNVAYIFYIIIFLNFG